MNPSWMYVVIGVSTLVVAINFISVTCGPIPCHDGLYGESCELNCSANCHVHDRSPDNNSLGPCDITGYCLEGCKLGYHGRTCKTTCTEHCVKCVQENGRCMKYYDGYKSKNHPDINEHGTEHLHNATSSYSTPSHDNPMIVPGYLAVECTFGVIVIVLLIATCVTVCKRTLNRKKIRKELQNILIPRNGGGEEDNNVQTDTRSSDGSSRMDHRCKFLHCCRSHP